MTKQNFQSAAPFIGRETELHQLHQALNSVITAKKSKFILIQGDFGVGKTALVERFLTEASAHDSSFLIGQGKCAIETELNGLIPFSQLLASLTEQGIQRRVVTGSLTKFVKEVAPAWLDVLTGGILSAAVKTVQEGGKLLGRTTFSKESIFVQYTNAISQLSQKRPVLAFIDDLQWADASSLGLLFHMSRYLQDCPVLVICTYRPVEATETGSNAVLFRDIHANLIRYGALELELRQGINVIEYVAQRYLNNTFSPNFIKYIQEKTEGHALFVSQLFSWWEETGVVACKQNPDDQLVWEVSQEVMELPSYTYSPKSS